MFVQFLHLVSIVTVTSRILLQLAGLAGLAAHNNLVSDLACLYIQIMYLCCVHNSLTSTCKVRAQVTLEVGKRSEATGSCLASCDNLFDIFF